MTRPFGLSIYAVALASLVLFAGSTPAPAEPHPSSGKPGITNFLTENTLVYPDEQGVENLIHFGRFGDFDWYFPCQIESGSWSLDGDLVLSLSYVNPRYPAQQYKLERREDGIALNEPARGTTTVAQLREGNHVPYF